VLPLEALKEALGVGLGGFERGRFQLKAIARHGRVRRNAHLEPVDLRPLRSAERFRGDAQPAVAQGTRLTGEAVAGCQLSFRQRVALGGRRLGRLPREHLDPAAAARPAASADAHEGDPQMPGAVKQGPVAGALPATPYRLEIDLVLLYGLVINRSRSSPACRHSRALAGARQQVRGCLRHYNTRALVVLKGPGAAFRAANTTPGP